MQVTAKAGGRGPLKGRPPLLREGGGGEGEVRRGREDGEARLMSTSGYARTCTRRSGGLVNQSSPLVHHKYGALNELTDVSQCHR